MRFVSLVAMLVASASGGFGDALPSVIPTRVRADYYRSLAGTDGQELEACSRRLTAFRLSEVRRLTYGAFHTSIRASDGSALPARRNQNRSHFPD